MMKAIAMTTQAKLDEAMTENKALQDKLSRTESDLRAVCSEKAKCDISATCWSPMSNEC